MPAPSDSTRSRLRYVWGEVWRLAVAFVASMFVAGTIAVQVEAGRILMADDELALDIGVGLLCFGLVLLRHRAPTTIALVVCAACAVSAFAVGPICLVVVSVSTHRRWWRIGVVGVVFTLAFWAYEWFYPPVEPTSWMVAVFAGLGLFVVLVSIGAYIGLRREHLASLHERLATAEREQAHRVAQARANERARIAREMHDVLAHRMSLVAMHAGALAYRTDLPQEQVAQTAALVRDSAHEALGELREVLGVLRGLDGPASAQDDADADLGRPERPQPTLADLPALARSATDSGTPVRMVDRMSQVELLPTAVSRTTYRIVQEALTNVRKHSPGMTASVVLRGAPGQGVWVTVTNPTSADRSEVDGRPVSSPPASGLGLLGLTERAGLAGGSLTVQDSDGRFVVRAWLPWAS